jgi:Tfp pilus assembly protein FimT
MTKSKQKGFTLVEFLITIGFVFIIAAFGIIGFIAIHYAHKHW